MMQASPVTRVMFHGHRIHVKRDDVFHLAGNKMRKMFYLIKQSDAFYTNAHIISYGGSQSNAMLALAQVANARRVPFTYFSRKLLFKRGEIDEIEGNLAMARALGMRHVELHTDAYHELVRTRDFTTFLDDTLCFPPGTRSLYVPQGAACLEAQDGVKVLAEEINEYVRMEWPDKLFSVVVPCGTGTTALYLAQHLQPEIKLFAVPCVGDATYLQQQFRQLIDKDPSLQPQVTVIPQVLKPKRKSRFGRLWWPLYDIYHEILQETEIDFDLVYGAFAWHTLFSDKDVLDEVLQGGHETCVGFNEHKSGDKGVRELLYIHTGGTSGNAAMLARYGRKNRP
ncbi:hypothetical protein DD237_000670 [Peronospora effusa]|uniref:Tryptophan synthase beta chain-like PALP domain-containing protein n=1 Tax=Peronospora effusa TaxID=542832 RepID=A0A425CL10_9STRA|nr:hypothetical protein DD237_000670 [Peronospora effusa]